MRLTAALAAFVALAAGTCGAAFAQPAPVSGKFLADELRKGGYVVYFRHTRTSPEHEHEARMRAAGLLKNERCETQRNLSETGFIEAKKQAAAVARLGIPVGRVLVSRYCRAWQHAQFFVPQWEFSDPLTPVRDRDKALALRAMLNTPPAPGGNTFMFAHGGIMWQATDYDSVESETFVYRPSPGGERATLVAAIRMEDWDRLLAGEPCCAPREFWSGKGVPPE
jgi:hypothetical protein